MFSGPAERDELASWTTAAFGPELTELALPMSALPWPGRLIRPGTANMGEQAVFVRTTPASADGADEAFYVHGLAGASANWTSLAGLLAPLSTGYAADLPGAGRSDPPGNGDYSVSEQVRVLAAVIREVAHGPVHLVGNSLGGFLSTMLAAAHPELFRSLTLISPAVPDLRITKDRGADFRMAALLAPGVGGLIEPRLGGVSATDRVDGMISLCFGDPSIVTDDDKSAASREIEWRRQLPWTQWAVLQSLRGLMKSYLAPTHRSYWTAAGKVQVPTLVVWGTRDRLVDVRLAQRTAAAFANSRLLVLAGVGHVAQMEAPAPTARAIAALWADAAAGVEKHDVSGAASGMPADAVATFRA